MGVEGLVDTAAVVGMFQRMDRVADSTGIPLDKPISVLSGDLQDELGLWNFDSARNTPTASWLQRVAGKILTPLAGGVLRTLGRLRRV